MPGGIETAVNGVRAAIDSIMMLNGYHVKIQSPPDRTYSGTAVDLKYAFTLPSSWKVTGSPANLEVANSTGSKLGSFQALLAWGAEAGMMAPVAAYANGATGITVQTPRKPCGSCTYHVVSKVVDGRKAVDPTGITVDGSSVLGWPAPVLVATSLSLEMVAPTQLNLLVPYGVVVVDSGTQGSNGSSSRTVVFTSQRYFSSVEEAKAWMASSEHRQVEKMIASLRVQ